MNFDAGYHQIWMEQNLKIKIKVGFIFDVTQNENQ